MEKTSATKVKVERITVERYDREEEVVRLEIVPLSPKYTPEYFEQYMVEKETENLAWWDTKKRTCRTYTAKGARRKLSLGKDDVLAENMVFWAVSVDGKYHKIYHVTRSARNLAKELYTVITEAAGQGV